MNRRHTELLNTLKEPHGKRKSGKNGVGPNTLHGGVKSLKNQLKKSYTIIG